MDITSLLIQLVSGAVGGNVAGGLLKNLNLGTVGNSILGILGGGLGGYLLEMLGFGGAATSGGQDLASILSNVASGGVGGGVLMAIVGAIRGGTAKS